MKINFVRYKKLYYVFTAILMLGSIFFVLSSGLKLGIDFTGGSILQITYQADRPSNQEIRDKISGLGINDASIQPAGEKEVIIRMQTIDEDTHQKIIDTLGGVQESGFESIGPSVGMELRQKVTSVIVFSILAMVVYIAVAFSSVSYPVKSWQYGIVTLFILFHDVMIPVGVFSILGKLYGTQVSIPVVVALLTVVGYAINNVVVVFDRIRENLLRKTAVSFDELVDNAINQTMTRQLGTSITTLLPLIFIYTLGGETLKYFALALILGIIAGLYSSLFLAGPILVSWMGKRLVVDKRR